MNEAGVGGYETWTDWMRAQARVITEPVACWLARWGVHPNTLTLLGFGLTAAVATVLASGRLRVGGGLLALASSLDAFDGALARSSGKKSRFGAFLDSTLDRLSEGALLSGLLVWALSAGRVTEVYLLFVALFGSVMVSYTRARAEGVGYACKVGLLSRVERVVLLSIGLMLGWVTPTLWVLAVLTWFTVFQRMLYVYRESRREP